MKYINTDYKLFDTCSFTKWFDKNSYGGGFSRGEGKITLNAQTTKLNVSMELYTTENTASDCTCWPIQIYFSDAEYNAAKASTVQINVDTSNRLIKLCTNNSTRLSTPYPVGKWHKVYLIIDSTAGTIDYYFDSDKVGTYTGYVKTGVKAINCKIKLGYYDYGNYYTKARNIIISDEYFPINEEILDIPVTVTNNGFTYDADNDLYSTENEDAILAATITGSTDGYRETACNVGFSKTVLGDTVKNMQLDMGNYSELQEVPASGFGMYWDDLPVNVNKFTVKSKK